MGPQTTSRTPQPNRYHSWRHPLVWVSSKQSLWNYVGTLPLWIKDALLDSLSLGSCQNSLKSWCTLWLWVSMECLRSDSFRMPSNLPSLASYQECRELFELYDYLGYHFRLKCWLLYGVSERLPDKWGAIKTFKQIKLNIYIQKILRLIWSQIFKFQFQSFIFPYR